MTKVALNDTNVDPSDDRNRLTFKPATDTEKGLANFAMRVNQKLVDRLGNIYTVTGIPKNAKPYTVLIDPPIPADVTDADEIGPVYFTPQTPASVTKVKIKL